jgi:hypothetical protein
LHCAARAGAALVGVDLVPDGEEGWTVLGLNGAVEFTREYQPAGDVFVDVVFTAGACPLDDDGRVVAPGDLEAGVAGGRESRHGSRGRGSCSRRPREDDDLRRQGAGDLVSVWNVVSPRLGRVPSTLLDVSFIGYEDQLVEIEGVAVVGSRAG